MDVTRQHDIPAEVANSILSRGPCPLERHLTRYFAYINSRFCPMMQTISVQLLNFIVYNNEIILSKYDVVAIMSRHTSDLFNCRRSKASLFTSHRDWSPTVANVLSNMNTNCTEVFCESPDNELTNH